MTDPQGYLPHNVLREDLADGSLLLRSGLPLGPVVDKTGDWLHRWAAEAPDRVFLAERAAEGWRELTYADALAQTRALAAGLLAHGIGPGKTIAVLSGPGVDHGLLALASQYVGAVLVPLAEQYSLIPEAFPRLDYTVRKVAPAMVFAADGARFGPALENALFDGMLKVVSVNGGAGTTALADLVATEPGADVDAAFAAVGPGTLAKILFTSGSTSNPKGVPQTQAMMCVNQAQYQACLPFLEARPPVMVDWMPWNHVFAGNSDFNMALANGGSLYLDDGKPVKGLFERTLENLHLKTGTLSLNVPIAYAMLVEAMRDDAVLRAKFFADLDMIFYAGASLPLKIWQALEEMALAETGRVPMMTSSWGMTETAPAAIIHHQGGAETGMIGVPMPGLDARLVPDLPGRYELRVRGPNVFAGYFEDPEKTAESFDEEGFFRTGDAVRFVDESDLAKGIRFDGRIAEEFKLMSGIWVQASQLRLDCLSALSGLVQDVVVTGAGHPDLGLLIIPAAGQAGGTARDGLIDDPDYAAKIAARLKDLASHATGSSNRIVRALVLAEPPSMGEGEITPKGSLNTKVILDRRAALVERLYAGTDPAVITV